MCQLYFGPNFTIRLTLHHYESPIAFILQSIRWSKMEIGEYCVDV